MIDYGLFIDKKVRIVTMVLFRNGRKINTHYIGILYTHDNINVILDETDGTRVKINKRYIKRIEEI